MLKPAVKEMLLKTSSMEQSLSQETGSLPTSQEIPCLLWNPKIHCFVHKSQPLGPFLSQMNPIHKFYHSIM